MRNYNNVCRQEECETKVRKIETDNFYCKFHV